MYGRRTFSIFESYKEKFIISIQVLFGLFVFTCPTQMKVPFEEVPELVAGRRVFIHKGYAYVAMNQVSILIPSY